MKENTMTCSFPIQEKGFMVFSFPRTVMPIDAECIREVINLTMKTMDRLAGKNEYEEMVKNQKVVEYYYGA